MVYQHSHDSDEVIVAEPNRSASWEVNKMVLLAMCCLSGVIAGGFALTWRLAYPAICRSGNARSGFCTLLRVLETEISACCDIES